jgi:glutathione S-transferase
MKFYGHPFSSYTHKALIALYENGTPFDYGDIEDPAAAAEWAALSPVKRFPLLADGDHVVFEATSIIEHLAVHHPGPVSLIPADPAAAVEVRMMDRMVDNYVNRPQQDIIFECVRPEGANRDPHGVAKAPPGLPPYLANLYSIPLLTKDEEVYYFRKYNYLKFKAARMRDQLDIAKAKTRVLNDIEQLLEQAREQSAIDGERRIREAAESTARTRAEAALAAQRATVDGLIEQERERELIASERVASATLGEHVEAGDGLGGARARRLGPEDPGGHGADQPLR